jgi:hypothetical protein
MNCFSRTRLLQAGRTLAAASVALGFLVAVAPVRAQDAPASQQSGRRGGGQGRPFAGMQRVAGEVVSVAGANVTVKTEDGSTVTVVTTDNTRIMKGRGGRNGADGGPGTVKVADLKPGDGITAAGILDAPNKTLHAALLFAVDAAQVKAMRENLGKTYIAGRVTAIDLE